MIHSANFDLATNPYNPNLNEADFIRLITSLKKEYQNTRIIEYMIKRTIQENHLLMESRAVIMRFLRSPDSCDEASATSDVN